MRPSEFWRMTPGEVVWLIEAKQPKADYGNMSEHEVRELYERAYGAPFDEDQ